MTVDRIAKIVMNNSFEASGGKDIKGVETTKSTLFGIKSLINHNRKTNTTNKMTSDYISLIHA